ncbi:hypothetical protein BDK51DRAFT_34833, partial [Blyttiomyces helicus]
MERRRNRLVTACLALAALYTLVVFKFYTPPHSAPEVLTPPSDPPPPAELPTPTPTPAPPRVILGLPPHPPLPPGTDINEAVGALRWPSPHLPTQPLITNCSFAPEPVRLFLGIVTTAKRSEQRQFVRSMYKEYLGFLTLCPGEVVDVFFVVGEPETDEDRKLLEWEKRVFRDIVHLPIRENMNEGKTYQ